MQQSAEGRRNTQMPITYTSTAAPTAVRMPTLRCRHLLRRIALYHCFLATRLSTSQISARLIRLVSRSSSVVSVILLAPMCRYCRRVKADRCAKLRSPLWPKWRRRSRGTLAKQPGSRNFRMLWSRMSSRRLCSVCRPSTRVSLLPCRSKLRRSA